MRHNSTHAATGTDSSHWAVGRAGFTIGDLRYLAQVSDARANQARICLSARDATALATALDATACGQVAPCAQGNISVEFPNLLEIHAWSVQRTEAGITVCFLGNGEDTATVLLDALDALDFAAALRDLIAP